MNEEKKNNSMRLEIEKAVSMIRTHTSTETPIAIILGTGLGKLAETIKTEVVIPYSEIPGFPVSTVESHKGKLIIGKLGEKSVIAMQGRFHYYEGYSMQQITFPVRVMKFLGASTLLVSNAAGGLNPIFQAGDIMLMRDHINLLGNNPLIGLNDGGLGPRFPDMSEPYSRSLIGLAEQVALRERIPVKKGVYIALSGPCLETAAEYRFLRLIGADAVGMSTVPEVIVAVHMSLRVLGFSVITDECFPDALKPADIHEIIKTAEKAEPKLMTLMTKVIEKL